MFIKVYTCQSESEISKNPGFTAEVLVQFHSPDGNRSYIDENMISAHNIAFGRWATWKVCFESQYLDYEIVCDNSVDGELFCFENCDFDNYLTASKNELFSGVTVHVKNSWALPCMFVKVWLTNQDGCLGH